jgi:hypothetical protein
MPQLLFPPLLFVLLVVVVSTFVVSLLVSLRTIPKLSEPTLFHSQHFRSTHTVEQLRIRTRKKKEFSSAAVVREAGLERGRRAALADVGKRRGVHARQRRVVGGVPHVRYWGLRIRSTEKK